MESILEVRVSSARSMLKNAGFLTRMGGDMDPNLSGGSASSWNVLKKR